MNPTSVTAAAQTTSVSTAVCAKASARTYTLIWAALLVLTVLTVAVADINLRALTIVVCLAIAAFKATLVLLYFMHLRYERLRVIRLVVPIAVGTLAIFIGLTFSDVFTR